jgi:hypothetical protein
MVRNGTRAGLESRIVRKVNGFSDHGLHRLQVFVGSSCCSELQKYGTFAFDIKAAHFIVEKKVRR